MVRLAGDLGYVVPRDNFNPVSWPEIDVIRFIHGEDAVVEIKPIARVNQTAKQEKERLRLIYGPTVEDVYPGKNPQMELDMPGAKLPDQIPLWRNPIDLDPADKGIVEPIVAKAEKPAAKAPKDLPFN
jgi:hypothetical protein